jgi:hydrogenase-4 component F
LTIPDLLVLLPFAAAAALAFVPSWRAGAHLNAAFASLAFLLACTLPWHLGPPSGFLRVDALAAHWALLSAFVTMTSSWSSLSLAPPETARPGRARLYHVASQGLAGGTLLALLSDNLGVAWIGMAVATGAAALLIGLPPSVRSVLAAWRLFIVCSVGLTVALFGTMLLYGAALPALGSGAAAISWSTVPLAAPRCDAASLGLAFVFLLLAYATVASFTTLHDWAPESQAPTLIAGLLPNVGLLVILRLRLLLEANPDAIAPGPPIMALGLLALLVGGFGLWRQRGAGRFFACASAGQAEVVLFAFGLGGPTAVFAGVLQMTLHTLARTAALQCAGSAARLKGGDSSSRIGGLIATRRPLGLALGACIVALAALPPFGLFTSTFLVFVETLRRAPLLALPLGVGLLACSSALVRRLGTLCFGPPTPDHGPAPGMLALVPVWAHLALLLVLGIAMLAPVTAWLRDIAGFAR